MASAADDAGGSAPEQLQREIRDVRSRWRTRQVLDAAVRLMNGGSFEAVSMQALAREAGVSVGLIYSYFGGKEDVVVAVVLDVVEELRGQVDTAIAGAGGDPVEQLAAAFGAYCRVLDTHRHAGLLTYRQSGELGPDARNRLKAGELTTLTPLREAAGSARAAGLLVPDADLDLLVFDLMILAHGWALKHWHFPEHLDVHRYVAAQTAAMLRSALAPEQHVRYRHLLDPTGGARPG